MGETRRPRVTDALPIEQVAGTGLTNEDFAARLKDATLPVSSLNEALPHLRRPFTPEAIRFKVQTVFKENSGCIVVAYIDARLVIERLNAVVGSSWEARYQPADPEAKLMWCDLRVFDTNRTDVGESPKKMSKDLVSDSLKRAAVHFGVGVSVYALPQITLFMRDSAGRLELRGKAPKQSLVLTEHGHKKLREGYTQWLETKNTFGPPLDHGDVEGQTVDEDAEAVEAFVPEVSAALDDDEAKALRKQAENIYSKIRALGPEAFKRFPPTIFNAGLDSAAHSHDEMRRFVQYVQDRYVELSAALGPDEA